MATTKVTTGGITDATIATADIANDAVTVDKIQNFGQNQIAGRTASGTGNLQGLSASDVRTMINVADGATNSPTTTINNNADNRVITGSGTANTLNGEANLTFNSSLVVTDGNGTVTTGGNYINLKRTGTNVNYINAPLADAELHISADENIVFKTVHTGDFNSTERIRIDSSGRVLIGQTSSNNSTSMLQLKRANNNTIRLANSDATATNFVALDLCPANSLIGARIVATADGTFSSGSAEDAHLKFFTTADGTSSERMRIDSSGNVGINDTSPTAELSVAATAPHIDLGVAGGGRMKIGYEGNNCFFGGTNAGAMFIFKQGVDEEGHPQASGTERMRIDNSGRVFFGATSTTDIGNGSVNGQYIYNGTLVTSRDSTSNREHAVFHNPNGDVGSINTSGSSTSYTTSSDYRLKENATAISDGITRLKTLKPYRFNFKVDKDTTVDGFFAHEVTAVPEAITGTKDEVDSDNKPVYQGIDQSKLVPLLTAALQEAIAKIEILETKVAALEAG